MLLKYSLLFLVKSLFSSTLLFLLSLLNLLSSIPPLVGHTCVNGAGLFGCMGALNNGCLDYDGHVVGVIHEMFVVDGSDWVGGSHSVFESGNRELLIARGDDLQQRKKVC